MLPDLNNEQYCYLTTTGRVSGKPHTIEIWFALDGTTLYMLSGGGARSDWVRNIRRDPTVAVRIGGREFEGVARLVRADDVDDALARRLLFERYNAGYSGDLTSWRETALPVAVELGTTADGERISG
jgi:deazaflavin-dependent oxidoreductase (nitroreductase family)